MDRNLYNFHTIFTWPLYPFLLNLGKENERNHNNEKSSSQLACHHPGPGLAGRSWLSPVIAMALSRAVITASNGMDTQPVGPGFGMMQRGMPMHNFGFNRGFERGGVRHDAARRLVSDFSRSVRSLVETAVLGL